MPILPASLNVIAEAALARCLFTGASAASALSTLAIFSRYSQEQQHARDYGTLDSPAYQVRSDIEVSHISTFEELQRELTTDISAAELSHFSKQAHKLIQDISRLEAFLAERGSLLNPASSSEDQSDTSRYPGELCLAVQEELALLGSKLSEHRGGVEKRTASLHGKQLAWKQALTGATHGSLVERSTSFRSLYDHADSLIESLTGKRMPDEIHFKVGVPADSKANGSADFCSKTIIVRPREYTATVLTAVHEMAHLICQHDESCYAKRRSTDDLGESQYFEEATAFGFELLAASWMIAHSPAHAAQAKVISEGAVYSLLHRFYSGKAGRDPHPQGMAYLDAARTALGSLPAAVNYLLSHDQLTPEMESIVRRNAATWRAPASHTRFESAQKQYQEVQTLWESLCSRGNLSTY
jgi:hypothetical protein